MMMQGAADINQALYFEDYKLDLDRYLLLRGDVELQLRRQSFEVLRYLAEHSGHLVTKDELLDAVWTGRAVTDDSVTHCLMEIRAALGDESHTKVKTLPRRGYLFDLPVSDTAPGTQSAAPGTQSAAPGTQSAAVGSSFISGRKVVLALVATGFVLVMILSFLIWRPVPTPPASQLSIAVLPFENRSNREEDQFFTDGIHDDLLATIAKIGSMKVISRTSVMAYRDTTKKIPQIAQELGVANILEGSIQRSGNQVRVNVQLIDAATDEHLWAEIYDRELTAENLFAVQSEIARMIADALQAELSTDEQLRIDARPTDNLQAYELYLRGRYLWQRRGDENIRHAITLFEQATELDPQFARAWSSLAATHFTLPVYSDTPRSEHYPLAASAAHKALAQDDSLAEAYAVLGSLADADGKWAEAETLFLLAIANEPMDSTAHLWYGEHLFKLGRLDVGLEEALIAYQLDPLHPGTNAMLGWIYFYLNDTSNALKYAAAAWDLGHSSGLYFQAWINLRIGEFDRAVGFAEQADERMAERFDNLQTPLTLKLFIEAKIDAAKRPLFLEMLAEHEMFAEHETRNFIRILFAGYVAFDRIDEAYRVATMVLDLDGVHRNFMWNFWRSDMAPFRQDPRFAALVTELGMVDYWREYGWPDVCQPAGDSVICK